MGDKDIDTAGGAHIAGGVAAGRDFVGRDFIQNIVVVGELLDFAQIEGLLPEVSEIPLYEDIGAAIEELLGSREAGDFSEIIAYVGSIMKDFVPYLKGPNVMTPVRYDLVINNALPEILGQRLLEEGYWSMYRSRSKSKQFFLDLPTLTRVYNRFSEKEIYQAGLFKKETSFYFGYLAKSGKRIFKFKIDRRDVQAVSIFIVGILLDLIRLVSDVYRNNRYIDKLLESLDLA